MLRILELIGEKGLTLILKLNREKREHEIIQLLFIKNIIKFFEGIQNEELVSKMLGYLSTHVKVFEFFPKLQKQIIKLSIQIFNTNEKLKVKFYAFIFIRELYKES